MTKLIVDRIENEFAICEDEHRNILEVNINEIMGNIKEGDVLALQNNRYVVDFKSTELRKKYIKDLTKGMWE